jgi:hypothetical protein
MITEYMGLFLGAPFVFLMGRTENLYICYAALGMFGFFRGIYDSNLFAALFDVIEPKYRSSSVGIMLAFAFAFSSLAPVLLGWIKGTYGLSFGMSFLSLFFLAGGLILLSSTRFFFNKDYYDETLQPNNS